MNNSPVKVRTIAQIAAALAPDLRSFPSRVLKHKRYRDASSAVRQVMTCSDMFLVVGPTRVGKGALIEDLVCELNEPILDIRDQLRAVVVTAPTAQGKAFSMGDLWKDALLAMDEPLVDRKVDLDAEIARLQGETRPRPAPLEGRAKSAHDRKKNVCDVAIDRRLQLLVIDEAYALVKTESGVTLMQQLDALRNLADQMPFRIALVSTGRILDKFEISGELSGRLGFVYFPHYGSQYGTDGRRVSRSDPVADRKAFLDQLVLLQEELPECSRLRPTPAQLEYLYAYSLGCVGHLIHWYRKAVVKCDAAGRDRLRWSDFTTTVLSARRLDTIRKQCEKGEAQLLEQFAAPPFSGPEPPSDDDPTPSSGSPRKTGLSRRKGLPNATRSGNLHDVKRGLD